MDEWWKRHQIDMGGYTRSEIEDVTGRIPLLLDKCVVDGKIDLTGKDLRDIYDNAASFAQDIRAKKMGISVYWQWYVSIYPTLLTSTLLTPTLLTLLTFQVSRLRGGLLPSEQSPIWTTRRADRSSVFLSDRLEWKMCMRFSSQCCSRTTPSIGRQCHRHRLSGFVV
jgi:hypothetical protein